MMRAVSAILLILSAAVSAAPAQACRTSAQMRSILFESLPPMAEGEVAARVEILSDSWRADRPQVRARVLAMLRGTAPGEFVTLRPHSAGTCHVFPRRGSVGIVVGRPAGLAGGELVIDTDWSPAPLPPG
jgi:hypothetical protein